VRFFEVALCPKFVLRYFVNRAPGASKVVHKVIELKCRLVVCSFYLWIANKP